MADLCHDFAPPLPSAKAVLYPRLKRGNWEPMCTIKSQVQKTLDFQVPVLSSPYSPAASHTRAMQETLVSQSFTPSACPPPSMLLLLAES